jgi:hypothetical protein
MTNFSRGQPKGKMYDNLQFFVDNPFAHSRFDSTCMSFNIFLRVIYINDEVYFISRRRRAKLEIIQYKMSFF